LTKNQFKFGQKKMKHYNQNLKEGIIADYLSGGGTYG
jgi:hypothetical protein